MIAVKMMKKAEHYATFQRLGLPVPKYGVFDGSSVVQPKQKALLHKCVDDILAKGSGLIGVRTEPKDNDSPLGNYPHYMPLRTVEEVVAAIASNESNHRNHQWWYLVNEAFLDYEWNAVVRLTQDGQLPGHWHLDGEVNTTDNLPLREALGNARHLKRAGEWRGLDAAQVRKYLLKSGLHETWIEVSKVRTPKGLRLVFWGMRNDRLQVTNNSIRPRK